MALRPDDAASLAKGVREMFSEAETLLLERIAKALAGGREAPDWAEQKLLGTQALLRSIDGILDDLAKGMPGAVERAVGIAYNRGVAVAGADLTKAGLIHGAFGEVPTTGAVAAIAMDATTRVQPMVFQIRRSVADIYQQTVTQTAAQVSTGVLTRREASQSVLTKLARNGITGFVDRSGRKWEAAAYSEMAVRTASAQAALQGHTDRLTELGVDTATISDSPEECALCRPWEGAVISLTGQTTGRLSDGKTVKGTLSDAKSDGVFHPGCTHSISIYLPGITKTKPRSEMRNPAGDKLRQQQRAKERRIRELKREDAIAQAYGGSAATQARGKLRGAQAEFRHWREEFDRKDLAYRTSLKAR